ncbi:MAG: hypothetical protein HY934_09825 [Candidatus Firestonebacteria bacterium]|nr:hypothetical protein [Candidatus Firestonebacteria bacterium]
MPFVVIILLSLFGIVYILYPFFVKKEHILTHIGKFEENLADLNDHKISIFTTLRDLEFDFNTNKISKEDFENSWITYKNNAIKIMKEMDKLKGQMGKNRN